MLIILRLLRLLGIRKIGQYMEVFFVSITLAVIIAGIGLVYILRFLASYLIINQLAFPIFAIFLLQES